MFRTLMGRITLAARHEVLASRLNSTIQQTQIKNKSFILKFIRKWDKILKFQYLGYLLELQVNNRRG